MSRYVLKKKLCQEDELMGWLDFLHDTYCRVYSIMTFKHPVLSSKADGRKTRIRFYLETMDFRLEHKNKIRLSSGFIPYQWTLTQQIKTSSLFISSFSHILQKGPIKDNIKTRLEWIVTPDMRLTLDLPGNILEIKTVSLARLYHFILENNHLFLYKGGEDSTEGRSLIDQE